MFFCENISRGCGRIYIKEQKGVNATKDSKQEVQNSDCNSVRIIATN